MNVVENDIRALVDKELAAANKRFPQFHSAHEAKTVIGNQGLVLYYRLLQDGKEGIG